MYPSPPLKTYEVRSDAVLRDIEFTSLDFDSKYSLEKKTFWINLFVLAAVLWNRIPQTIKKS